MVDPNPMRGMPPQLMRYWVAGKGAAKIRWGAPHDFNRCVRNLRKYFPKDPEGLCNILHQRALGAPPGKGHAMTAAAELLASQPSLGDSWFGPLAPIGRPTGEPRHQRMFMPDALDHRTLPLPLMYRDKSGDGHGGAVTVGRILGITYGPGPDGAEFAWAWGDWLDPEVCGPMVTKARYLAQQGVVAPSVDPGGPVAATYNPETGVEAFSSYTIGGATLVPIAAFGGLWIKPFGEDEDIDDDDDMMMDMLEDVGVENFREDAPPVLRDEDDDECGCKKEFAVNSTGWRGLPLAPRKAEFDNDDAVRNIAQWASVGPTGTDVGKLRKAFLWVDPSKPPTDPTSYRLPVGDVVDGRLTLNYHAIYAAAALISGAHGGLPDVPESDKGELRRTITGIYQHMAKEFNDSSVRAPWDRPEDTQMAASMTSAIFAIAQSVVYADPGYQKDGKKRYPIDSEQHVRAAWGYINQRENAAQYTEKQLTAIRRRIITAAKKLGIEIAEKATEMSSQFGYPLEPPREWFSDPKLGGKDNGFKPHVEPNGRVFGYLAKWDTCHTDLKLTTKQCYTPPRSRLQYAPFLLGEVVCDNGEAVRVGKIVFDTRHAGINLGYASAAVHYDNTGDEAAIVTVGEDNFGLWYAGAMVPEADERGAAKLRRSPLSGDWRAIDGNLELTAALAVNVPAFPVYATDGDVRLALTASSAAVFVADQALEDQTLEDQAQEDRAWELREILDQEEQDRQAARAAELFALTEAAPPADEPEVDELAMELDGLFSLVEETPGTGMDETQTVQAGE